MEARDMSRREFLGGMAAAAIGTGLGITQDAEARSRRRAKRPKQNTVARIIFAETNGASDFERQLVASVMRNRVGNPAFGNLRSMDAVVRQHNAFEALGDKDNANWARSANPGKLAGDSKRAWEQSVQLASDAKPAAGPSGRLIVYYHDKSISKPKGWDNKSWHAVKEIETPKLIFYSIVKS